LLYSKLSRKWIVPGSVGYLQLTQLNKVSETAALTEGQRIVIPHSVGQKLPAPNPVSSEAAGEKLPSGSVPNPVSSEATGERLPSASAQNPVSSEQQF
jgi:hypothetical protein